MLYDTVRGRSVEPFVTVTPAQTSFGTIRVARSTAPTTDGIIEVDGTFVGVVSELAGLAAGSSTYFVAPLDTALLRPGRHTVRLWTATRDHGTVTLRLVE